MFPALIPFIYKSTIGDFLHGEDGQHSWALVTGASDGIGQGFAQELCSRGFNVVLHGRNEEKLKKLQLELKLSYPTIRTRLAVVDAAIFTPASIESIYSAVEDVPLRVLINNIGGTGALNANFQTFEAHTSQEIGDLVNINVMFTLQLTERLLPLLKAHKPSLIMNIGSQARVGTPFLSVYSGTKAFIHTWTRCLKLEMDDAKTGIEVMEILVASVQSQQNQTDAPTFFVPSAREMARSALMRVGSGRTSIFGYFPHALQWTAFGFLPEWLLDSVVMRMLRPVVGKTERRW